MKFISIMGLVWLGVFPLATCGPRPIQEGRIPTLGPAKQVSGGPGGVIYSIEVSLNCVEVGEVVTITATLEHATTAPFTITTEPVLDIRLSPHMWPDPKNMPVQRWSATDQYPAHIEPVWMAGESRSYQWQWTVDPDFVQRITPITAIRVAVEAGEIHRVDRITPAGAVDTIFSVGTIETERVIC